MKTALWTLCVSTFFMACTPKFESYAVLSCGGPNVCAGEGENALHCTLLDALANAPQNGEVCESLQKQLDVVMTCFQREGQCVARGGRTIIDAPACQILVDDLKIQGCDALPFDTVLAVAVNELRREPSTLSTTPKVVADNTLLNTQPVLR